MADGGNVQAAVKMVYRAVKKYPTCYSSWLLFSKYLFQTGHTDEAIKVAQHADSLDPFVKEFDQISVNINHAQWQEARRVAKSILDRQPYHPKAIFTLASVHLSQDQPDLCVKLLEESLVHLPANLSLRKLSTTSYERAGNYAAAIDAARLHVSLDSCFATYWTLIGLLFKYGQYELVLDACVKAQAYSANDAVTQSQLELIQGQTHRILGNREKSIETLKRCITSNPSNVEAWWALADFKTYDFSADERVQLETVLTSPSLSKESQCLATFALAKLFEKEGQIEQAMVLYSRANSLKDTHNYTTQAMSIEFDTRKKCYDSSVLKIQATSLAQNTIPIFIVGLPRSGSTLIEQMLASHSQIEGTMEQPTLPSIERKADALCRAKYACPLYEGLKHLTSSELSLLGQQYIDDGAIFRHQQTDYFIDKQPFNFRLIGFIHKILPNAIIIDMRRDPIDCGFSLFKQYFHSGVHFSYQLRHIAETYRLYVDLMDYWQAQLPERIIQVSYEQLVSSPEAQFTRVLDKISIPLESQCLRFHETRRAIHTSSSEQVREPINSKGIGAWRAYEPYLQALISEF